MTKKDQKSLLVGGGVAALVAAAIYWFGYRRKVIAELSPVEIIWDRGGRSA